MSNSLFIGLLLIVVCAVSGAMIGDLIIGEKGQDPGLIVGVFVAWSIQERFNKD